ncbi:MAG: type 1 glutamine amidotransferase [Gammaproteobacteria bacterium]|uniref:type 1 glutamine amidotransferase n=1 Tax=Rhodoferax sp. TaxID=50421 RepID=UPI0017EC9601|nr:type 1 glutamine amidotransferase [Rhodoferax sp.]MBU3897653.1 type 1 glutamine amidotransferase [Gammaproteobacteria bacterium]MBA3058279.1 type 1 glutamine amidotransferase [Rhodoferax sp.]MBU3999442.1 type 1 glutamine amidotransferase [Gammaproteobacteria bacterium]MBU4017703.1 type 1 glutamine amidotransferase [Gammaproteobacteria bacterium]MBU4081146.1 type 1 glutamine amidotransferase [Gammaproteobacteria bacterium]
MNIHYLQHVPFEGPGNIVDWVRRGRHTLGATRFYCGDPLPAVETLDLLVVMGGPMNVYEEARYPWLADEKRFIEQAIAAGRRVLGVCLGAQLVADVLGAKVYANTEREIGWFPVEATKAASEAGPFAAFPRQIDVFHWHGDTFDIPAGAVHVARSAGCANQAFVYDERIVGLQFHLETTPANAQQIIAYCADEIVEDRFIQSPQVMLANPHRFKAINYAMRELLDRLTAAPAGGAAA